jgi:VWFA-related protein
MTTRIRHSLIAITLLLLCVISSAQFSATAPGHAQANQSQCDEKPKLKDFGSTLKRLKWDAAKQQAVDAKAANEANDDADDVIRVHTDLVVFDAMVLDPQGRPVAGLRQDDFVVTEDNQPQAVNHFSLGSNTTVGRSIVIVMDHSGSLLPYLDRSVDAARLFIDKLSPNDRVAIVTQEVKLLVNFTCDKRKLKKVLQDLKINALAHRQISLPFSALLATARESINAEDIRPIIIFQTDGDQIVTMQPPDPIHTLPHPLMRSLVVPFSLDDVSAAVEVSRATVYTVIPGFRFIAIPKAEQLKRAEMDVERVFTANGLAGDVFTRQQFHPSQKMIDDNLDFRLKGQLAASKIAARSGGWTSFLEQPDQADAIYSSILNDINSRYVIGYYSTNKTRDGKRRQVSITVKNHPEYTIWGRKSYIAPEK